MRVTQSLVAQSVQLAMRTANERLFDASKALRQGTSLERPSDDLSKAERLVRLNDYSHQLERFDGNRRVVKADLQSAEEAVGTVHELVVDAHNIALNMASDEWNADTRGAEALAVRRIIDQVQTTMNRRQAAGNYLFTGLAEDKPALDAQGQYQGNDRVRRVMVAPGLEVDATLTAPEVLGAGNELITTLTNLANALETNDAAGVRSTIDDLEASRQTVSATRSALGARISTLQSADDSLVGLHAQVNLERDELKAVDVAKMAPEMTVAQTMLQAVVDTSRRILDQVGTAWLK